MTLPRQLSLLCAYAVVLSGARARANDSSALLEAGGIVLTKSADVSMESEELWISRKLVKVSYLFKNSGPADLTTEVAFPMPAIPVCEDPDHGDCDGDIQLVRGPNPMQFKLTVDGRPATFKTDEKTEMKRGVGKKWITLHWTQTFPKDRTVAITHQYVPVAGGFFSSGQDDRKLADVYCVGPKLLPQLRGAEHFIWVVHYILTTGANWKGPIKRFKLTIAKESPKDKVSLCIPDTRRTSPTTFEVTRENFVPGQDLEILFIPAGQ